MKQFSIAVAFLLAATSLSPAIAVEGASPKSDIENEKAIRSLYEQYAQMWNKHDVEGMANMWSEDGDHVDPDGHVAKGRGEVHKMLSRQHQGVFKSSKLDLQVDSVWFIAANVALVDGSYQLSGVRDPQGNELPARKGRLTSVFLKERGRWWIVASRLMIPAPLPWREQEVAAGARPPS